MEYLSEYDRAREQAESIYVQEEYITCPAFPERIYLTAEGFNHLIFKKSRQPRERQLQIVRFRQLPRALMLIKRTTTYQEYEEVVTRKSIKIHYWGIIAIIDGYKIKVILRKIGNKGRLHFWSVIPGWITSKRRDNKRYMKTASGDLQLD